MRRIVFAQEFAPSVGGETLKTVVKKRQDFGSTEGCAQKDSVAVGEKRRKKKENDTVIEAEVQENWAECDSCQKWRLLPSTCIAADVAPFQCSDAHRSCEDAGDDEKAEEELEVETPQETAPEVASGAIAEDVTGDV